MSLIHYGFTREEVLWMPISEMFDYIQLINEQIQQENEEIAKSNDTANKNDAPTLRDVYNGPIQ